MSIKSLAQVIIIIIIFSIIGSVYFIYFKENDKVQNEVINTNSVVEKEISNSEINKNELLEATVEVKEIKDKENLKLEKKSETTSEKKDLVKEKKNTTEDNLIDSNKLTKVEYLTSDKKGNKYVIIADSGQTDGVDKDVLNLDNVKGRITSNSRSDIFIVSDYAKYNSKSQKSFFYDNVVINFEDKQIDCDTFDLNLQTNLAVAKGNVIVTDPISIMRAGKITLDISTKDINIEPAKNKKINLLTE